MAIGDLVPWRWGSLRRFDDDKSFATFRSEMEQLHRSIDRLFADAWGGAVPGSLLSDTAITGRITPRLDVTEDDKAFHVTVELPGMTDKDVAVSVTDRALTIRGEKKEEKETKDKDVYRRERAYGSFRREIELPSDVDAGKIEAAFKSGVLTIDLPKTKEAQDRVKQIPVKAA
ncbi:MAG TPA: Hsp20/alpha crystallin family protein [Gammaproteobacteria bacterium]